MCWRAEIIQVGLNMHLYVDIGDASSSLWGSTTRHLVGKDVILLEKEYLIGKILFNYASLSSGEAYRDQQLTTNFGLALNFFVCHVSLWGFQNLCLSVPREKKSPWLRQITLGSNWYINGKVFTSTTAWKPQTFEFLQKSSKLNFDLCWRAEINIQVGLNIHLYDGICDASLFLLGSISSWKDTIYVERYNLIDMTHYFKCPTLPEFFLTSNIFMNRNFSI